MKTFRTWAEKHILAIGGFSMLIGLITMIAGLFSDVWPAFWTGLLMLILPPIIGLTALIILTFSFFWETFVKPFFLWISWIRKRGFSALFTREYGVQLIAVILICFVLYQFRIIIMLGQIGMFVLAIILVFTSESGDPITEIGIPNIGSGFISLLILFLVTLIPGFFVGLLTDSKERGSKSIGIGSFLGAWVGFAWWAPEMFSWDWLGAWLILIIVLILIGMTILSFIVCGFGILCAGLGEMLGIYVRREIFRPIVWKLKGRKEALAWELEDRLTELKEQLSEGVITQEEYEQKRRKLLEGLTDLKELDRDVIHPVEQEQKKLLDFEVTYEYREALQGQLKELQKQLGEGVITQEEYEQKKKKLLENSEA